MSAERVQQDGYVSSRDRRPSDSTSKPTSQQQDSQYSNHTGPAPPHTHQHHHHHHHGTSKQNIFDVSRAEFEQFQQQVSYNYDCIQAQQRDMMHFDRVLNHFQTDVTRMLEDLRTEIRARGPASDGAPIKIDSREADILAGQIANVTTKVNEVENLKIQVELMKSKIKRLETESSQSLQIPAPRPSSATSFREGSHDAQGHHVAHQPLPPIQTGSESNRYHSSDHNVRPEHRPASGEYKYTSHPRPGDSLPPPSNISTWRPGQPPYPHDAPNSNWPSNGPAPKRPYEESSAREQSPASPKRPKLAPLKPRSAFEESQQPPVYSDAPPYHSSARAPPREAPPQILNTPASVTSAQTPYRFITSTTPMESRESWRAEDNQPPASARDRAPRSVSQTRPRPRDGAQEHSTPEWEQKPPGWQTHQAAPAPAPAPHPAPQQQQQLSPNGGYYAGAARPALRPDGATEYPLTPIASAISPHDHSLMPQDTITTYTGKKTRTKPVRNSDGVLIRKDGRPDMRSVSSANNLRKVHAKKEAERAETDARTPSARPLAPSNSNSVSDEDEERAARASRSATPKTTADDTAAVSTKQERVEDVKSIDGEKKVEAAVAA